MENFKRAREIAEIVKLPRSTIYYLIRKWNIRSKKKGLKRKLYDFEQFMSMLNQYYEK
jgi:transposase